MKLRSLFSRAPLRASRMIPGKPKPSSGRDGLAIVAIMKDEAGHIADWLRFHAAAGVTDFFLYDDGSSDGTVEIARSIAGLRVDILPWKMSGRFVRPDFAFSRQILAYSHAIENFGGEFRWMAFLDIDECLFPQKANSLLEVLEGLEDFTNISVPWTMFGPGEHEHPPEIPAQFAYTRRAAKRQKPLLNFKCIVDPADVTQAGVHRFSTGQFGQDSANDQGVLAHHNARHRSQFLSDQELQLNHYYTRSRAELHIKLAKGAVSDSPMDRRREKVMEKLAVIEATATEDNSAIDFLRRVGVDTPERFRMLSFAPTV